MLLLKSEIKESPSIMNLSLAKIAWITGAMMAEEYGFTIIELFAKTIESECPTIPLYDLTPYLEERKSIDIELIWQFDMSMAETLIDIFEPFYSRKKQLKILHALLPDKEYCQKILDMLT